MKPTNAVDGGLGRLGTLERKLCEGALSVAIQTLTELTTLERQLCAVADTRTDRLVELEPIYWGWGRAENNYRSAYPVKQ